MLMLTLVVLAISDLHLAQGDAVPKINDFPSEAWKAHLRMLATYLEQLPAKVLCDHVLNGDWFDFLAVPNPPGVIPWSQEAALAKADTILAAYEEYIVGLRALLVRYPNLRYRIVIGNHDLEFRWPSVQARVIRALAAGGDAERVTFHEEYVVADTVLHVHGDAFDKPNANPPEHKAFKPRTVLSTRMIGALSLLTLVLSDSFAGLAFWWMPSVMGWVASFVTLFFMLRRLAMFCFGRRVLTLNVRLASRVHASFGMWLKKWFFPEIGRHPDHGDMYMLGIARKPYAALPIVPAFLIEVCQYRLDEWAKFPVVIWNTTGADQYLVALRALCWKRRNIEHVIGGHTHVREAATFMIGDREVEYYNGGLSGLQVHTSKPEVHCRTPWTKTETFCRRVAHHWVHAFPKALFSTIAYAALPTALFLLPPLPVLYALRWPVLVLAVFLLFVWQATAAYVDRTFVQLAPVETRVYHNSVEVTALLYDGTSDSFLRIERKEKA